MPTKNKDVEVLITACPKFQIHFSRTQNADDYPEEDKLENIDLTTLFAEAKCKYTIIRRYKIR